jgi:hypothetical protein
VLPCFGKDVNGIVVHLLPTPLGQLTLELQPRLCDLSWVRYGDLDICREAYGVSDGGIFLDGGWTHRDTSCNTAADEAF